ncbi:MAG: hypothetical protein HN350_18510 [Phycisphaerales bacterium]|nr:hypothetical protein [Phycisphaerales bacterium]
MSRRKKKSKPKRPTNQPAKSPWDWTSILLISIMLVATYGLVTYIIHTKKKPPTTPPAAAYTHVLKASVRKAKSLPKLLAMTPEQLAKVDIAEMNLLCAAGLPACRVLKISISITAWPRSINGPRR